jgi:inosine-uridine nucleoside N-ribohydrolase
VVVDCDPGLDDALALAFLVGEGVPVEAVTAVGGNFGVAVTAANARYVARRLGLRREGLVYAGDDGPGVERRDAAAFHGPDGLGGLSQAVDGTVEARLAAEVLADYLAAGRPVLAIGPLTNVAAALTGSARGPITVMGGAFGHPAGNVTPWAEFNWWCDPVAADQVCQSGLAVSVVALDVTQQVVFDESHAASLPTFAGELLARRVELEQAVPGRPASGAWVHDAVAAVLALDPGLAEWTTGRVSVTTTGEHGGSARLHVGDGPVRVALAIDAPAVRARLLAAWARVPSATRNSASLLSDQAENGGP